MSFRRPRQPAEKRTQQTPEALRDDLLDFLERKFYPAHRVPFLKDRPRLLAWVVLWPAKWLNDRGVTIPADRYREIFMNVFMDSLRFGAVEKVTYFPAWLAKVIQSHFAVHGDEIYDEGKNLRAVLERTLFVAGKQVAQPPDPVRSLAAAADLLKSPKRVPKQPVKQQLTLL